MPFSLDFLKQWLSKINRWPKWALGLGMLVLLGICIVILNALTGNSQAADAADPYLNSTGQAFDVFLKLGLVVVLIYIGAILFKKWRGGLSNRPTRQLSVVESLSLGPKRALHLVKAGDQLLLIGATDQALSLIAEVNPSALFAPDPEASLADPQHLSEGFLDTDPALKSSFPDTLSRATLKQ